MIQHGFKTHYVPESKHLIHTYSYNTHKTSSNQHYSYKYKTVIILFYALQHILQNILYNIPY